MTPQENAKPTLPNLDDEMVREAWHWLMSSGVQIGITLLLSLVAALVVGIILGRVQKLVSKRLTDIEGQKRVNTLFGLMKKIARFTIFILAFLIILSELGVDMGPLLATAGVLALAVSFGAQSLVKDVISGFFLLAEDQIRVGDIVQIGDHSGTVEDIRIRTIILRDLDGNTHVIPNGAVESFVNMTKGFSRAKLDIGVAYREDLDRIFTLIEEEGKALAEEKEYREKIIEPLTVMGLQELGDSALVVRCTMMTTPGDQWQARRRFLYRIKKRFDAEGVEIPFPHRTIYWGEPGPDQQQGLELRLGKDIEEVLEKKRDNKPKPEKKTSNAPKDHDPDPSD